jgi:hypothetical protein
MEFIYHPVHPLQVGELFLVYLLYQSCMTNYTGLYNHHHHSFIIAVQGVHCDTYESSYNISSKS